MRIIGLDLSLTSPGAADETGAWAIRVSTKLRGPERLDHIRKVVVELAEGTWLKRPRAGLVVIEGYSMGSRGAAITGLAELGGVVRVSLWRRRIPFVVVPPMRLKKFATGKGNANKDTMLIQAIRRSEGVEISGNDAADAWWLRQMGLVHYGLPDAVGLPANQVEVVGLVDWPEAVAA